MKTLGRELWRISAHFAIAPAREMLFISVYQRPAMVNHHIAYSTYLLTTPTIQMSLWRRPLYLGRE